MRAPRPTPARPQPRRSNCETPEVSVILPVYNEAECIEVVMEELFGALKALGDICIEILAIDDGSTDDTPERLSALAHRFPTLRVIRLEPNAGQSAALGVGFRSALGTVVVTLDADGQNDPADIPQLVEAVREFDVCCGYRAERRDKRSRRVAGRLANSIRRLLLHDDIIDTGCTLKAFRVWVLRDLPMWKGMHRFLPMLASMRGATIKQIPVNHRPRVGGTSKYTNWRRLRETAWDIWAVRWMQHRNPAFTVTRG